jgi:Fur family peroxide stress response transcriptional regulator
MGATRHRRSSRGHIGLTRQRQAVLDAVRSSHGHLTAAEVFEAARSLLPGISYATVYNSLRFLKEAGLVAEVALGNGASRYDREVAYHDHALCTGCGELVDIELSPPGELIESAAQQSRFAPESLQVTLLGTCPDCQGSAADGRSSKHSK